MQKNYEDYMHYVDDNHWWLKSRRHTILQLLKNKNKNANILDIGSSQGLLLKELLKMGYDPSNLYAIDISESAIQKCNKLGINASIMDANDLQFPPESFDIIISSDSLEHLKDDIRSLKSWHNVLKKDGELIVFVPAFRFLWSVHDEILHHYRRYSLSELKNKLKSCGFKILRSGYWNNSLFMPILCYRFLRNLYLSLFKERKEKVSADFKITFAIY